MWLDEEKTKSAQERGGKTMSHAERCPVCEGKGKIKDIGDNGADFGEMWRTCHGCDGKGWVTVHDKDTAEPIYSFNYPNFPLHIYSTCDTNDKNIDPFEENE